MRKATVCEKTKSKVRPKKKNARAGIVVEEVHSGAVLARDWGEGEPRWSSLGGMITWEFHPKFHPLRRMGTE